MICRIFFTLCLCLGSLTRPIAAAERVDVAVYGGTPSGIAAAIAAADAGHSVLLVEPYSYVGGLVTNGLSHTDFHSSEGLTGAFLDFAERVEVHYADNFGPDSPEALGCIHGAHAEPHVNRLVFEAMLAEHPNLQVIVRTRLASVDVTTDAGRHIDVAHFASADGESIAVSARIYIDASYEGDLLAMAGVAYRVGREGRDEYNESLAPEEADGEVQGYNFRLVMTQDPAIRVLPNLPAGYERDDFVDVVPLLESGDIRSVVCDSTGGIYKAHLPQLPHGKHDVNDVSRGLARLSLPDINDAWPDGDFETRREIYDAHLLHNVGLLYFLQNDESVPAQFRDEAREWGFCNDEFIETSHIPEQLYIREGRRMVGQYVFTEHDTDHAPGDARSVLHTDTIAQGEYGPNCHGTHHEGPRFGGRHGGEFYKRVPPYQIPYGVLVPRDCDNLLVPTACSASHVGFCALRLEPIWMSLGQASGHAAHLALTDAVSVQDVNVSELQQRLHERGAATIYVSDVPRSSPDFAAVQWWGTQGGLHTLEPMPDESGQRGAHLHGQYYAANPGHAAKFDQPVDADLREKWLALATFLELDISQLDEAATRGEFIRAAYQQSQR